MYDCGFDIEKNWFRYRAAAIIIENDCVLLVSNSTVDYYYSVGGGVHMGETSADAVKREVWEETGLTIEDPVLCGIKQWAEEDGARAVVLFYKTNRFSGELKSSEEGDVFWVRREEFERLPLAKDMAQTIRVFESDTFSECFYTQDENGKWRLNLQ